MACISPTNATKDRERTLVNGYGMGLGMGFGWLWMIVLLVLADLGIAALINYLRK